MKTILPGAIIGVMGGGQLGRMFAMAARSMGYRVHIFTPEHDSPASQFADDTTEADFHDEKALRNFCRAVDLLTFEFENIPRETLQWCAQECTMRPAGQVIETAQHRLREKTFLSQNGFPVVPFCAIRSLAELVSAVERIGRESILKTAAWGYDGKGQQSIASRDLSEVWQTRSADELILERAIDFETEISVIIARDPLGNIRAFPVAENVHRNHILDVTLAPAVVPGNVAREAVEIASAIAEKLQVIGLLAVEMFLDKNGKILVNELAPRPHNSGHWTIEGCATSQFEQQLRAICGLPLGSVELLRPSAMANLLGDLWSEGEPYWDAALSLPNVHLHLYGKHEPRPRRKMGHLTATADSADKAATVVREARDKLCARKS